MNVSLPRPAFIARARDLRGPLAVLVRVKKKRNTERLKKKKGKRLAFAAFPSAWPGQQRQPAAATPIARFELHKPR